MGIGNEREDVSERVASAATRVKKKNPKVRPAFLARAQRISGLNRSSSSAGTLISTHQYEECNESHRAREVATDVGRESHPSRVERVEL